MKTSTWNEAVASLRDARHVVVFTGAGVSAESGVPTFRDAGGLWEQFPPEKFASWDGLLNVASANPRRLAEFLIEFIDPIARAQPNPAHRGIVRLEQFKDVSLVTQNVDSLHQAAGSIIVREIHGTLFETVDAASGSFRRQLTHRDLKKVVRGLRKARDRRFALPRLMIALRPLMGSRMGGVFRPNLVMFGDELSEPAWEQSQEAARRCDAFLSIGTSQAVWPAGGLPLIAQEHGAKVFSIDPEKPASGDWLEGKAGEVLPKLVEAVYNA